MYFSLLLTFAAVAATLLGFIGVVFILGQRSDGRINDNERSALWSLLAAAFSSLFFSLLVASLLAGFPAYETQVWRIGNALAAVMHMVGAGKNAVEAIRGAAGVHRWAALPGSCIGFAAAFANTVTAFGYFSRLSAIAFVLSTLWALMVTALAFTFLLSVDGTKTQK